MGYQKFVALGNVTGDVKTFKDTVAKFSLAVNGYKESVTFFNCVGFQKRLGEKGFKLLSEVGKGTPLLVDGEFQAGEYDKDGVKTKTFDLVVSSFQFVTRKSDSAKGDTAQEKTPVAAKAPATKTQEDESDESIPF